MNNSAIYAGSFDPPTNGHLWMIEEALGLFEDLRIVIGINPNKKTMFSLEERIMMLKDMTAKYGKRVQIEDMYNQYLVDYAQKTNTKHIIRGLRSIKDYEYEREMNDINRSINKHVSTIFFLAPPEIATISSSTVKSLIGPAGWELEIIKNVPPGCLQYVLEKGSTIYKRLVEIGVETNPKLEHWFWKSILAAYTDPSRAHHDFVHIARMLKDYLEHGFSSLYSGNPEPIHELKNPLAMEVAVLLHDVVNIPGDPKSEEMSADFAATLLQGAPPKFIKLVRRFIMATKHSKAINSMDKESAFIIDLDLSILGKDEDIFDLYEANIRKEYAKYSDQVFARGRIDFLKTICARERIFTHAYFYNAYEKKARANMARSIDKLERSLL